MTERQICKYIVRTGDCRLLTCIGLHYEIFKNAGTQCPIFFECFNNRDKVKLAEKWLEEHGEE